MLTPLSPRVCRLTPGTWLSRRRSMSSAYARPLNVPTLPGRAAPKRSWRRPWSSERPWAASLVHGCHPTSRTIRSRHLASGPVPSYATRSLPDSPATAMPSSGKRPQSPGSGWPSRTRLHTPAGVRLRRCCWLVLPGVGPRRCYAVRTRRLRSLGALPLCAEIEGLARRGRINLSMDSGTAASAVESSPLAQLGLTAREQEVLTLVATGATNRQIAETLFISPKTATLHVSNILSKLGVTNRVEAATIAHRLGVITPST